MIGRNLLKYLVNFELCSFIRVVDKQVPGMAYLSPDFQKILSMTYVDLMQADLSVPDHVERAFAGSFNIVINLASETQYGHFESKYERNILQLRGLCAKAAAQRSVEKYIEVSTAQVYDGSNDKRASEKAKTKPWTTMAKFHLEAESVVKAIDGLPVVVLRLPIVYGPGDLRGLMPRIVCAAVYEHTQEKMEFLWGEDLRMHTVHVQDAAAAVWHLCCAGEVGETYNLVDDSDTTQGKLNALLETMFDIQTGFYGSIMSNLAQLKLEELVDEANDGHLTPWNQMLKAAGIAATPLNPYLEKELLYNNPLAVDGTKMKETGFSCSCPSMTAELLLDSIKYWEDMGLFPPRKLKK